MCTVTIHRTPAELLVTMNRDETLSRGPELPPRVHADGPHAWAAPRDGDKGGTWMGVNSCGLVACLLNAYQPGESLLPDTSGRFSSRGEIIPRVMEHGDLQSALKWLADRFDPTRYPSFTLMVLSPTSGSRLLWLGGKFETVTPTDDEWLIYSSSGWDSLDVIRWREDEFLKWRAGGEAMIGTLPSFHAMCIEGQEERSPLMRRSWSATRSITQASVNASRGEVCLRYWPEPEPDTPGPSTVFELPLEHAQHKTPYPSRSALSDL